VTTLDRGQFAAIGVPNFGETYFANHYGGKNVAEVHAVMRETIIEALEELTKDEL